MSWSPPLSLDHTGKRSKNLISLKIFVEWFLWYRSSKRNLPDLETSLTNLTKARWSLSPLPLSWLYTWWPARRWKAFRTRRKRNAPLEPARCLRRILDRWFCLKHPWWRCLVRRLSRPAWISPPGNIPYRNVGSEWPVISFVVLKSPYSEISLIWNRLNSVFFLFYILVCQKHQASSLLLNIYLNFFYICFYIYHLYEYDSD